MQQFLKIIDCLKRDEFYAIMVEDAETNYQFSVKDQGGKSIVNLTGDLLTEHFGSVEDFFNKLYKDGYEKIKINFRRKNGSTCKKMGEPKIFVLNGEKKQPEERPASKANNEEPEMPGLSRAAYNSLRYPEVVQERNEYKEKYSRAKKKIKKLELEKLQSQFSTEKSKENKEMLLGIATKLLPLIAKGVGSSGVGGELITQAAGMAAPTVDENKIAVWQRINLLDDDSIYYIALIAEHMSNPEVQASVIELVKKHELDPQS